MKNEPTSRNISINISHESGKGFNTSGVINPKTINVIINNNEIMLKYFLTESTSLTYKSAVLLDTIYTNIPKHLLLNAVTLCQFPGKYE